MSKLATFRQDSVIVFGICFLILFLCCYSNSQAALFKPEETVLTLSTKNFNFHFTEDYRYLAEEYAEIAERVHEKLAIYFDWQTDKPTEVVLSDLNESSGGYMTSRPRNRIVLHLSKQTAERRERLFIHEYTHVMQLDQARGFNKWGRYIFGRVPYLMPNYHQPTWMIEGLAEYIENKADYIKSNQRNNELDMNMRTEVNSQIKSLAQLNFGRDLVSWPKGFSIYLYGKYFYDFIEHTYGVEKISKLGSSYSDNPLPYFINMNSQEVLGKNMDELWIEFEGYLRHKFDPEISEIKALGIQIGELHQLDKPNLSTFKIALNERSLYYTYNDGEDDTGIFHYNFESMQSQRLFDVSTIGSLDLHSEQGLLYSQIKYHDQIAWIYDLYIYDPIREESRSITSGSHCREGRWNKTGEKILAICRNSEGDYLALINNLTQVDQMVFQKQGMVINSVDWHLSENSALLSVSQGSPEITNLVSLDIISGDVNEITTSQDEDFNASYIDEETILFSRKFSDGSQKLFVLNKTTNQISEITNSIGAAVNPVYQSDTGHIYYSLYQANGWHLYRVTKNNIQYAIEEFSEQQFVLSQSSTDVDSFYRSDAYASLSYMTPTQWWPLIHYGTNQKQVGFRTFGADVINRHQYYLQMEANLTYNEPMWAMSYAYTRFRTDFEIGTFRDLFVQQDRDFDVKQLTSITSFESRISRSWRQWDKIHNLDFSFGKQYYQSEVVELFGERLDSRSQRNNVDVRSFSLSYYFSTAKQFANSINRTRGISYGVTYENRNVNDDYSYGLTVLNLNGYLQLPLRSILKVKTAVGSAGNGNTFHIGGLPGEKVKDYYRYGVCCFDGPDDTQVGFGARRFFPLRGYPEGLPELTGNLFSWIVGELQFPISTVERNMMRPPLGMRRINAKVFVDFATIEDIDSTSKTGVGMEINFELSSFYRYQAVMNLGAAKGLDDGGELQLYFRVGSGF